MSIFQILFVQRCVNPDGRLLPKEGEKRVCRRRLDEAATPLPYRTEGLSLWNCGGRRKGKPPHPLRISIDNYGTSSAG